MNTTLSKTEIDPYLFCDPQNFKKGLVCFAGTKLTLCNMWSYETDVLYVESSFELKATFYESFDITLYDNTAYLFNPHFDAYVLYVT